MKNLQIQVLLGGEDSGVNATESKQLYPFPWTTGTAVLGLKAVKDGWF